MTAEDPSPYDAARRSLRAAAPAADSLRERPDSPDRSSDVTRVVTAVDHAIRRLLRDDPRTDLDLRLRALDAEEIDSYAVVDALEAQEVLDAGAAAAVRELLDIRRLQAEGVRVEGYHGEAAVTAWDRLLERVISPAEVEVADREGVVVEPAMGIAARRRARRGTSSSWLVWALVAVAVVAVGALFLPRERERDQFDRGMALFSEGEYADAASYFWRYAEANPREVTPHLYLARIHRRLHRPELARDELERAVQIAPDDRAIAREHGFLMLDEGHADSAVVVFRELIDDDRESVENWAGMLAAFRAAGRGSEADSLQAEAPSEIRAALDTSTALSSP